MGSDNADLAGPWQLMAWPRQTTMSGWVEDIRVKHVASDVTAIELVDGPWSCSRHDFRDDGLFLDLTLLHIESGRSVAGTFDLEDGVWAPGDGTGQMTVAEFHRAYAAANAPVPAWPGDPFKEVRAPGIADVGTNGGQYVIDLTTNRWRMSDWICPPRILHIPTGDCLLDLKTTYWDGRARTRPDGRAELRLVQYPSTGPGLLVELDLPRERYRLIEGAHGTLPAEGYLDELQAALGRSAADLEELGIVLEVRASRRAALEPALRLTAVARPVAPASAPASADVRPAPRAEPARPAPVAEPGPSRAWMPRDEDFNPPRPVVKDESEPGPEAGGLPMAPPRPVREPAREPEAVGGPELTEPGPVTHDNIRDLADAIAAEVTRRGLHGKLQYEMIVIGVLRAAAAGITRPEDAVAILETLALRRGEIGR